MIAVSAVTSSGRCSSSGWRTSTSTTPSGGGHVVGRDPEVLPAVAAHEIGGRILQLGDDRSQRGGVGRGLEVADDVDLDAELVGDAHRLA